MRKFLMLTAIVVSAASLGGCWWGPGWGHGGYHDHGGGGGWDHGGGPR